MRGSEIVIVGILILCVFSVVSPSTSSQHDVASSWNAAWSYRQELRLPIATNDSISIYKPIDIRIVFDNPCWTENEQKTSIRICCWANGAWHELESQIYNIKKSSTDSKYITECNVIFLVPVFADGTEQYYLYYHDSQTAQTNYPDRVNLEDAVYSSSPLPDLSAQARYYGIREDGVCIYAVGQDGYLLDRSVSQIIVKQKKGAKDFDLLGSDQIVSFAFSYYYGSKESDESASDQVFVDKRVFVDGNLMVEFGIISESKKKDIQTTVMYRYYYYPGDEKRINVHVRHEMLQDALVQGMVNIDGRFGSIIALKSRSATVNALNFGELYPFLNFYGKHDIIEEYKMNQNPASKEREWIISYKNDADLGKEAWVSYGWGRQGKSNAIMFSSHEGIVKSGIEERDGIQLKVAAKEYFNFLGTEVDYVSINFGRNSYEAASSHDRMIPSDLLVEFDAQVFATETGGYSAVQREASIYQILIKARQQFGDVPFEREKKRYNITITARLGGAHLSYPRLSNFTDLPFPVMWIELHHEGKLIDAGIANRSLFQRASQTFQSVFEGEYLIKVFRKTVHGTKRFIGATIVQLSKDTKVNVFCTWERTIHITILDQEGNGIPGVKGWLANKDGVIFDENITDNTGGLLLKAPYNRNDPYTLHASYKDFIISDEVLQKSLKRLNVQLTLRLYSLTIAVTDNLNLPPGVDITPVLVTTSDDRIIQLTPENQGRGVFYFEEIPAAAYVIQINYGDFLDQMQITVPTAESVIPMRFSAQYDLTIDLFDRRGNLLYDDDISYVVLRQGTVVLQSKQQKISLPPAQYKIQAYLKEKLIGEKELELTNTRHFTFVTALESTMPYLISLLLFILFLFFAFLTFLKKFSFSSLLKCLVILLVALSFFQPWWQFAGVSQVSQAEKNTTLYINPGVMIDTTTSHGKTSLDIAEMPEVFIAFLAAIFPLSAFACLSIGIGIVIKKVKKKTYALILYCSGIVLLLSILSAFYVLVKRLTEASLGTLQGQGVIAISVGQETVLMQSKWGLSIGFNAVLIAAIVAIIVLILDIRAMFMKKKIRLSLQNLKRK